MQRARALALTAGPALLLLGGCGADSQVTGSSDGTRTIDVTMVDNAFQPASLRVEEGETVVLRFRNGGTVTHEAVLGDEATQEAHHEEMAATSTTVARSTDDEMEGMDHGGDGDGGGAAIGVSVEPGQTAELTHTFDHGGTLVLGCHEPGHWEDGMKATVEIR
jgi:uncharacterized cupredoxin-like copper-binding protein